MHFFQDCKVHQEANVCEQFISTGRRGRCHSEGSYSQGDRGELMEAFAVRDAPTPQRNCQAFLIPAAFRRISQP